jgi:hypothetical protein
MKNGTAISDLIRASRRLDPPLCTWIALVAALGYVVLFSWILSLGVFGE